MDGNFVAGQRHFGETVRVGKYRNIHGRRAGRGLRPWLLIPKIIAVIMLLGGLAAAAVLLRPGQTFTLAGLADRVDAVAAIFHWLVIPGSTAAILLGVALIITNEPRVLLRLRWVQVKLVILVVALPALHIVMRQQLSWLRQEAAAVQGASLASPSPAPAVVVGPPAQMSWMFVSAVLGIAAVLLVLCLSRLKPMLGQNRARIGAGLHAQGRRRDTFGTQDASPKP